MKRERPAGKGGTPTEVNFFYNRNKEGGTKKGCRHINNTFNRIRKLNQTTLDKRGRHLRLATPLPPSGLMMLGTEFRHVRGLPLVKCTGLART